MRIESTILADMPPHPSVGAYVETFAGHHIYGRSGCFACPELGLWGYMGLDGMRRAILRVTGVLVVRRFAFDEGRGTSAGETSAPQAD